MIVDYIATKQVLYLQEEENMHKVKINETFLE